MGEDLFAELCLDNFSRAQCSKWNTMPKAKNRCDTKPETYEQRKRCHEEEFTGLTEALSILSCNVAEKL